MESKFNNLEITDKGWIEKVLGNKMCSEAAFGTHFIWSTAFNSPVCDYKGVFLKKFDKNGIFYEFPRGADCEESFKEAVKFIFDDAKKSKCLELRFAELLSSEVSELNRLFPDKFEIIPKRDKYEYVYFSEDLALLSGKKYHKKKNHVSKFSKTYDWKYTPTNSSETEKYMKFFEKWFKTRCPKKSYEEIPEYKAVKLAVENYSELNLQGGKIEINGEIVACTLGEKINEKIFLVHFEKALPEYDGAYSVINNEFAKTLYKNYQFINREEDMGIPGLRKSKLSYKPVFLIPKYEAVLKDFENDIF